VIRHMVEENMHIQMEQFMKGNGRKTSKMDMGERFGLMELSMREIIFKEKNMDKESLIGVMDQNIKDFLI